MLQLLPNKEVLTISTSNPTESINIINSYIEKYHCENLNIDISHMNIFDACYVSTMCSTKHFIKYPKGNIDWKISSELVRDLNKSLELGNTSYSL